MLDWLNKVHCGKMEEVLPKFDECCFDSCVTDPPYGFRFMGQKWDYDVPASEQWSQVLRVLKPGAHLLAFGGQRTYHRMVCNIEDAGFEIRNCVMCWTYGSGFPKSLDVSKAIDKELNQKREVICAIPDRWTGKGNALNFSTDRPQSEVFVTGAPSSDQAKQYQGCGTDLKPAVELICVARKPISERNIAQNVMKWGTGGINVDGCRIEGADTTTRHNSSSSYMTRTIGSVQPKQNQYVTGSTQGRFPSNTIFCHHPDCTDNECHPECHVSVLDGQSGTGMSRVGKPRKSKNPGDGWGMTCTGLEYVDTGGASRFFYCPKASRSERGEGNTHPTVKPLKLMEYLVRLVTPAGGVIVDPFGGSGSTAVGAHRAGFEWVLIEQDEGNAAMAEDRIRLECSQLNMFHKRTEKWTEPSS